MLSINQDSSQILGFPIPDKKYLWSVWDCFTLADYVFFQLRGYRLPDISWVYDTYKEDTQPKDLVLNVVKKYCRKTDQFTTGDLVVLKINDVYNLGIVCQGRIIYMGTNTATCQPIERMSNFLDSIWQYNFF